MIYIRKEAINNRSIDNRKCPLALGLSECGEESILLSIANTLLTGEWK